MFDRLLIDLGDGPVEIDVLITSVEPPSGDLVAITVGPLLYDLGPFSGELAQERLVRGAFPHAKRALGSRILVGDLAGQIEHQLDALRLKCLIKLQRQIARGTALPRRVTSPTADPVSSISPRRHSRCNKHRRRWER